MERDVRGVAREETVKGEPGGVFKHLSTTSTVFLAPQQPRSRVRTRADTGSEVCIIAAIYFSQRGGGCNSQCISLSFSLCHRPAKQISNYSHAGRRSMYLPKHQIRAAHAQTHTCDTRTHRCRQTTQHTNMQLFSQQLRTICGRYRKVEPVNVKCLP